MKTRAQRIIGNICILAGVVLLATTLTRALFSDSNPLTYIASTLGLPTSSADTVKKPVSPLDPRLLEIPTLGIKASVQYTGLKTNGQLGTPTNFTSVAWYKNGPAPGQTGTAVIDGHVDNGLALAGVFKHLDNLEVGDKVYVVDNAGTKLTFLVTDIKTYSHDSIPEDIFVSNDKASRLNLITCTGDWIASEKTYDQRLVVYTTLIS